MLKDKIKKRNQFYKEHQNNSSQSTKLITCYEIEIILYIKKSDLTRQIRNSSYEIEITS